MCRYEILENLNQNLSTNETASGNSSVGNIGNCETMARDSIIVFKIIYLSVII